MEWAAGTSGYSYKEWKGSFYPEDLKPGDMLAFYASKLPAVEINNTFYRMPRSHVLEDWRNTVPPDFRFIIKASRRITHHARLKDVDDSIQYLAERLEKLEDTLGCVLFQLPPYLRKGADRLEEFLTAWPSAFPAAIEFRHESWFDDEITEILARHGAAICVSEDGKLPLPDTLATTDWLYFRLRKPGYTPDELAVWLASAESTGAERGYAFFKHEDDGAGPALAAQFLDLAAEAATAPRRAKGPRAATRTQAPSRTQKTAG